MNTPVFPDALINLPTPFLGLAPFLRMSIAGQDIAPVVREYLSKAELSPDDAELWMNLSVALQCVDQQELGLAAHAQALAVKRIFHLPAAVQPAKFRLLMLMAPGDLSENTPLDCLLENSDIDLIFYYVTRQKAFPLPVPEHDAVLVGLCDSERNRGVLAELQTLLAAWPKPVINGPRSIALTERSVASALLEDAPGILMPPTRRVDRSQLLAIGAGQANLQSVLPACDFPIILRPIGSQGGRDLDRIERPEDIAAYLGRVPEAETEFFVSPFIDYRGTDGLFRKARVALIDGRAFACHMALSANWMIHYVNANMYEDPWKRSEEIRFMEEFDGFVQRHQAALAAICQSTGLDYLCLDCAETRDGRLLIFEFDHVMVVHAMDSEALFPYKQHHMQKVKDAFRDFVFRLGARQPSSMPA